MNNNKSYLSKLKSAVLCLSILSLMSLSSCGIIEMRDSNPETQKGEADTELMLAPAQRKNEVAVSSAYDEFAAEKKIPKTVIKFAAAGEIQIDDEIIADAANRASDGHTYGFLKMYSCIYRSIHDADVAVASYPTVSAPCGDRNSANGEEDDGETKHTTPIESLAALSELGFDALDTSGAAGDCEGYSDNMIEYDIGNVNSSLTGNDGIYELEKDGVAIAFLAADGTGSDEVIERVKYADLVSDVVVVSVNWSENSSDADKRNAATIIAESGADVIIGSGDSLGNIEWLNTNDGTSTLVAYSLGHFAATSDDADELCGAILSLDITISDGSISLENVCAEPTVIHYNAGNREYQIFKLTEYSDDISAMHAVPGMSYANITQRVRGSISAGFLPKDLRG